MNRPDNIPVEVWRIAQGCICAKKSAPSEMPLTVNRIARAILAERDRCKRIAYQEKTRHEGNDEACVACLEIAVAIVYGQEPGQ